VTAGLYGSLAAIQVDASGALTAGYNAWNATPTYPANQYVLGSNSKLYKAVISNAGNDPTTDGGTNWVRASIPLKPSTDVNQTLYWDGNEFTASTYLRNTGSAVYIGNPASPIANVELQIWGTGGNTGNSPLLYLAEQTSANNSQSVYQANSANSKFTLWGLAGTANDFFAGTVQGDSVFVTGQSRFWMGVSSTAVLVGDTTGVNIGGTGTPGAKLDVTAAASGIGLIVTCDTTSYNKFVNTTAPATSGSGGVVQVATTQAPSAADQVIGWYLFGGIVNGSSVNGCYLKCTSAEAWDTTHRGTHLSIYTTSVGVATQSERVRIHADGDLWLNATGSALATNATVRFPWLHNMAGIPTGTPSNTKTGNTAIVGDTTNLTFWGRFGTNWCNIGGGWVISNVSATGSIGATTDYCAVDTSGGAVTMTLPDAATRGPRPVEVRNKTGGANNVTIARAGSDTINSGTTGLTLTVGQSIMLIANGTDWQTIGTKSGTSATIP
jgi:hypothetical protein